jgi:hypothetical protein
MHQALCLLHCEEATVNRRHSKLIRHFWMIWRVRLTDCQLYHRQAAEAQALWSILARMRAVRRWRLGTRRQLSLAIAARDIGLQRQRGIFRSYMRSWLLLALSCRIRRRFLVRASWRLWQQQRVMRRAIVFDESRQIKLARELLHKWRRRRALYLSLEHNLARRLVTLGGCRVRVAFTTWRCQFFASRAQHVVCDTADGHWRLSLLRRYFGVSYEFIRIMFVTG